MKKIISTFIMITFLMCSGIFAGSALAEQDSVKFGSVNWPGVTVKSEVAAQILEALGYEVEITQLQVPAIFKALSMGQLDAFLGTWLPTMNNYVDPYMEKESITLMATNLNETKYSNAVPRYVYEAGVTSLEDLDKPEFRDKFDLNGDGTPEVYGIEPGNDGNKVIIDAIDNDTYGLGDWDMIPSSTAGMLSQVKKAAKNNDWIVFLGWEPHWMNIAWDLAYPEDPKRIWGDPDASHVDTAARAGLEKDSPNLARFFKQFVIQPEWQSEWIMGYTYEENPPEDVAHDWIAKNLDKVKPWLDGVQTLNGEDGLAAVKDRF